MYCCQSSLALQYSRHTACSHLSNKNAALYIHSKLILYQKLSKCNILLTFLSAVAITGHQEDNKPFMYTLPWALVELNGGLNGEVHRLDELLTQANQIEG